MAHIAQRLAQVNHLAVIDNGAESARHAQLAAWAHPKITYVVNDENNLAKAQNIGIAIAKARGDGFVMLLDDDSTMSEGMMERLLANYVTPHSLRGLKEADGDPATRCGVTSQPIGLIAPLMVDAKSGRARGFIQSWGRVAFRKAAPDVNGICPNILTAIASGSLISIAVLDNVGGMDESYGIDYVDKEFCLRLRQKGYRIVADCNAKLLHTIGSSEEKSIVGFRLVATNHSPARRFTIYRNRIVTLRRYALKEPAFTVHELLGMSYDWLRIALFEQNKKAKFCAIWNGMKAGFNRGLLPAPVGEDRGGGSSKRRRSR